MARELSGTGQYYSGTQSFFTGTLPVTMACWYRVDSVSSSMGLMSLRSAANGALRLGYRGDLANDPLYATVRTTGGMFANASVDSGVAANTWAHAAAVFASTTSRTAYTNGTAGTTNTTSRDAGTSINTVDVGNFGGGTLLDGQVAEAAIWTVALTTAEIALLADGLSPLFVRPQSLAFYAPLFGRAGAGGEEEDWVGGAPLTATGSPTVAEHPRIIYPRRRSMIFVPGAGGGAPTLSDLQAVNITAGTVQATYDYTF